MSAQSADSSNCIASQEEEEEEMILDESEVYIHGDNIVQQFYSNYYIYVVIFVHSNLYDSFSE